MSISRPDIGAFFLFPSILGRAILKYMERFIDAHCHFDAAAFAGYRGAVRFICNGTRPDDWGALLNGATNNSHIIPAIGLHPWYVDVAPCDWMRQLRDLLVGNPHLMVGEIGLDRARGNIEVQYDAFIAQYKLAAQLQRAVHIHCVRAWDIMLNVIKTLPTPPIIVAHRFAGTPDIIDAACHITNNIYFSYRDVNSSRTSVSVAATPVKRILVETDGTSPTPNGIANTIGQIATARGLAISEMSDIIYENSLRVINNGQIA